MISFIILFKIATIVLIIHFIGRLFSHWFGPVHFRSIKIGWGGFLLSSLLFLVILEQCFLWAFLNKQAMNDHVSHVSFVDEVKVMGIGGGRFDRPYCEQPRLNLLYSYELCVRRSFFTQGNEYVLQYSIYGVLPKGYLTLIPWSIFDREIWDSFRVARLNDKFEIIFKIIHE